MPDRLMRLPNIVAAHIGGAEAVYAATHRIFSGKFNVGVGVASVAPIPR